LPPFSIDSFETLVGKYGMLFATGQPHHMTSLALIHIMKKKGESLKLFMERFGKLSL